MNENFLSIMKDTQFKHFITPRLVGILYLLAAVIGIIIAFFQIISAFEIRWWAGLLAMVMAPVGYLIFMLFVRVTLESLVALIRTAENTTLLLEQKH
jgi:protein-S-isoprenylcysteine O-methyltransferase Ste14